MNRKHFLKSIGLTGAGLALFPMKGTSKATALPPSDCILVPSEIAGPFPLDLTDNSFFLRQDVREDRAGAPLKLKMRIIGADNCEPMPNVRVHIWHCDKDGNYSGYNSEVGLTYLRGYQIADANGEVEFTTIFPGWYPGRVCHFHFQVFVSQNYAAISQFTFEHDAVNEVYNSNPAIYTQGEDPKTPETDGTFSDGYTEQLATLSFDEITQSYESYLEVTVQGAGTTGVSHYEREAAKIIEIKQNFPNPYIDQTTIPFELKESADVKIELWSINGERLTTVLDERKNVGQHLVKLNIAETGLPKGNYIYQVEVKKGNRIFRIPKMMTYQG